MKEKIERKTHIIDAFGVAPGRLATRIAVLLRGKNKTNFTPRLDQGDNIIVENVNSMKITGNKMDKKIYYSNSMYPGGLKSAKMKDLIASKGMAEILRHAVYGMLPANKLKNGIMKRLIIK
ncbi:50S ribosomal protein L13 [Candidatus Kuenenbacteria bacterium CG11_big_fil_rev_8_21_14_0_20_37_9]|uniref:Large ribosomal subunit protein uL13 n=2 Tax=Candidatus Kueneniibacteriota TaxID=1752740 RepID=A0A2M6XS83_9BACT|nr:MAG: 50S ribosomal protein L13 [Candidatus Kuenenbacteria bacterium CG1_02_38_13]PIR05693.1 MAG: 50S ribosomal protein L13 [Candidatus Kuenenbacteria bacterium CG11_big_fil_rev_8_21_14_0_20_37_9]PIU10497.1 MAG: 50S ribosomal protein L13 [Candidatus Kuenenbacteria bacterium CG08_land_8_20_14_0_20_37_23]